MPGGHHLDIPTDDLYWFAGSVTSDDQYQGGMLYTNNGTSTADQMARGSNYGDMVDTMRSWLTTYPAPSAPYIETEDGLVTGGREISPPELNWAVWSTIVHGARMIVYFGTTSNYGSVPTFGFSQNRLPNQSISMFGQASITNNLVQSLAPVINSPFALHYASVTPAAYVFPTRHRVWDSGVDVMAKYDASSNSFYIFASPRGSESQTNVQATFSLAGNYSGVVPVTCACSPTTTTGTVSVSNHRFTDTFAHSYDVHVYGPIPNNCTRPGEQWGHGALRGSVEPISRRGGSSLGYGFRSIGAAHESLDHRASLDGHAGVSKETSIYPCRRRTAGGRPIPGRHLT